MLKNILSVNGVLKLNKNEQKTVHGGISPECAASSPTGCFSGPFYCNIYGLPICYPIDEEA